MENEEGAVGLQENVTSIVKRNDTNEYSPVEASDNQFFFEDEVFRIDKKGRVKFGMVIETCDTCDEDDYEEIVSKGEVRVAWYPSGKGVTHLERDIGLVDRTLMPGDIVRRLVRGPNAQSGYVREVNVRADVRVFNSKLVIKNVNTQRLRNVVKYPREAAVCLNSWIGSTTMTEERVILRTLYGARIEVASQLFWVFEDYDSRRVNGIYTPVLMFPGNVITGRLPSADCVTLLTPNISLRLNRKGKPLMERFIVESVLTDSAWVRWQCRALSDDKEPLQQPDPVVFAENLKNVQYLNVFEACMMQISDRNFLQVSEEDIILKKTEWDKEQEKKYKIIYDQQQTDEYQSLYVNASGMSGNTNPGPHEKIKKKQILHDSEKSGKLKLYIQTIKTEKSLNAISNMNCKDKENHVKFESCTEILSNNTVDNNDNDSWMTEEEEEDEQCEVIDTDDMEEGASDTSTFNERDSDASSTGGAGSAISMQSFTTATTHYLSKWQQTKKNHSLRSTFVIRKLKKSRKSPLPVTAVERVNVGDEVATEILLIYSKADVVWQDGSIEHDIESTDLYPIHHLDNHEFFPGDFVISGTVDGGLSQRDYGVIQTVDHLGRTAQVKWYTTYSAHDDSKPKYNGQTEASVYDLKDHPDFQFRPGTMVIRVANYESDKGKCTAGQVLDNYRDGCVKVWWVDNHISMCWPQDLFEVGQHVQNDWDNESDDSWETASENSDTSQNMSSHVSHILSNIDRVHNALERLEEIFNLKPSLQNIEVIRKLLNVYAGCEYLDRLLNTSYFKEEKFMVYLYNFVNLIIWFMFWFRKNFCLSSKM